MRIRWDGAAPLPSLMFILALALACCRHPAQKTVQAAPPPARPRNLIVLLPETDGTSSQIVVRNAAGTQTLSVPYQALRVDRADSAPLPPITMDANEVQSMFGAVLDALPTPEVSFAVYFDESTDVLTPESQSQISSILEKIRERHSTAISIIGHTDTTGNSQSNYQLGLRRAQSVAKLILARGAVASDLFIESHGDADLLVKTGRNMPEPRNRRVEIIVR